MRRTFPGDVAPLSWPRLRGDLARTAGTLGGTHDRRGRATHSPSQRIGSPSPAEAVVAVGEVGTLLGSGWVPSSRSAVEAVVTVNQ